MLSEGNAVHPVAQVSAVHLNFFYYDGSKHPDHYCSKTHTCGHGKGHYPEASVVVLKSSTDASSEDVRHKQIQNTEAEDYCCVDKNIPLHAVLLNDGDVDTVMFCDTLKQCLHAFILFLAPFRAESEMRIGPPYRHVFGDNSVKAQMPSIREFCQVQRMAILFTPDTIRADGIVTRSGGASHESDGRY